MKLTIVVWDQARAYFFKDSSYIKYAIGGDYAAADYPRPIKGNWKGLGEVFPNGVDAVVTWNNGFAYFFQGPNYVKYNMDPNNEGVQGNVARPIKGNWKQLGDIFPNGIDAAVTWNNGFAYFFKGPNYVKYNMAPNQEGVEPGYPRPIKGNWKGLAEAFPGGIDAGVVWPNGFAYFFKGDQYVRYNMDPQHEGVDANYPRPIKGNWCGLFGAPFADPDAVIRYSQPANFFVFDKTPGEVPGQTTTPGGDGMFMIYRIDSIQNNSAQFGGPAFTFKLANLFAITRDETSGNTSLDHFLKSALDQKIIPSGDIVSHLGTIVVRVAGDPQSLKTAAVDLHYCEPGVNVSVLRSSPNQAPQFLDPMTPQLATTIKNA